MADIAIHQHKLILPKNKDEAANHWLYISYLAVAIILRLIHRISDKYMYIDIKL